MIRKIYIIAVLSLLCNLSVAQLSVAPYIGDSMVLQHGRPIVVSGKATPGSVVGVQFAGAKESSTAAADSSWSVTLPAMKPSSKGRVMVVECGRSSLKFRSVLIGDVWFAAGQSNMAFKVKTLEKREREELIERAACSNIRYYYRANVVSGGKRVNRVDKPWESAGSKTIPEWSAVAYLFAQQIYSQLDIPIGIVNCSHGSSTAEAWISPEAFAGNSALKGAIGREYEGISALYRNPSTLYEQMLKSFKGLSIKGVIWYQGESNGYFPDKYATMFAGLITDWRRFFGDESLPFVFAQLPSYRMPEDKTDEKWAELRWAQYQVGRTVPNTAMVVTTEYGDSTNIHPRNKRPVALRFAAAALASAYAGKSEYCVLLPDSAVMLNGEVVIKPINVSGALSLKSDDVMVELCGSDGVFRAARCRVDLNSIYVTSSLVPLPIKVRYAWRNVCRLDIYYNEIPVPSFELNIKN